MLIGTYILYESNFKRVGGKLVTTPYISYNIIQNIRVKSGVVQDEKCWYTTFLV